MEGAAAQHLQSLTRRALVVAPVRIVAGLAGLAVAIAAGSPRPAAVLAFALAALGLVVVVVADPRRHLFRLPDDPPEADAGAVEDGLARLGLAAIFPSTAGVAMLALVALLFEPTLTALLAGILVGLGLAALVTGGDLLLGERRRGRRLFLVRGTQQIVVRRERG